VLFSTQVGIVDIVTRITGDILYERVGRRRRTLTLKRTFLILLTVFALSSMGVVLLSWWGGESLSGLQPDFLVLIAGPFTIASMVCLAGVIAILNTRHLPAALRMPRWKLLGMYWSMILWGWFTAEQITRTLMQHAFGLSGPVVTSITFHPVRVAAYATWLAGLGWVVARTIGPGWLRRGV
ncbi:MAG TPA: hypothetical protein VJP59_10735, partial [Gemmatimonadota bacterium]|nr:hypothetical protein [Gemmatimonadota bacterium]